jgi:hypothetical protein
MTPATAEPGSYLQASIGNEHCAVNARRRLSRHGAIALLAMLAPGVFFPLGLYALRDEPRFAWLRDIGAYPWEFWAVAAFGCTANFGGTADWLLHRSGITTVSRREHLAHVIALTAGGLPLFVLMACASLSAQPNAYLVPVFVLLIFTVVLISYDEFIFHRRCGRLEALFHRMLTFGNGFAFLAWVHWCFVRGVGNA